MEVPSLEREHLEAMGSVFVLRVRVQRNEQHLEDGSLLGLTQREQEEFQWQVVFEACLEGALLGLVQL